MAQRDASKLLLYGKDGSISETVFANVGEQLPSNSLLVFNNTKVIRARMHFRKETGAKIDIDDDGTVSVAAVSQNSSDAALARIRDIVAEPELNEIYDGKVVKTVDFGAFVNFLGARDGLVHISELKNERVAQTTDVVSEGDMVKVKVIGFDNRGKVKLSMKRVDQETGVDIDTANETEK